MAAEVRDVRDREGNLLCQVDDFAHELIIERRVHGRKIIAVIDTNTLQFKFSKGNLSPRPPNARPAP